MSGPTIEDDKRDLRELALRYARACDTHDADEFAAIFTEDGEIVSPGFTISGRDRIVAVVPGSLKSMYLRTLHIVHNDMAWVDGDTARGETYCTAHHLTKSSETQASDHIMSIVYDNRFRKVDGRWYFSQRTLNLKWSKTEPVDLPAG